MNNIIELRAEFELDEDNRPVVFSRGGKAHYPIRLLVENAPADTYAVTYQLHESYYDPIRESRESSDRFNEEITSYGDYVINAKIRRIACVDFVSVPLSEALERSYRDNQSPAIASAIQMIKNY